MSDKFTDDLIIDIARPYARDGGRWPSDWIAAIRMAVEAEREACAKVCEAISDQHLWDRRSADLAQACRDAIRARGAATTAATAPASGE